MFIKHRRFVVNPVRKLTSCEDFSKVPLLGKIGRHCFGKVVECLHNDRDAMVGLGKVCRGWRAVMNEEGSHRGMPPLYARYFAKENISAVHPAIERALGWYRGGGDCFPTAHYEPRDPWFKKLTPGSYFELPVMQLICEYAGLCNYFDALTVIRGKISNRPDCFYLQAGEANLMLAGAGACVQVMLQFGLSLASQIKYQSMKSYFIQSSRYTLSRMPLGCLWGRKSGEWIHWEYQNRYFVFELEYSLPRENEKNLITWDRFLNYALGVSLDCKMMTEHDQQIAEEDAERAKTTPWLSLNSRHRLLRVLV